MLTPPGAGAIGVIRIQGPGTSAVLKRVFRPAGPRPLDPADTASLRYGMILDGDTPVDDVVVAVSRLDGTTTADLSAHGGVRVIERLLDVLQRGGATLLLNPGDAPPAWPASSLVEHEAIESLTQAASEQSVRFFARQRRLLPPALLSVADRLEAGDIEAAKDALTGMLDRGERAQRVMAGLTVALVGPPNSGKSTIFNRLAGREAAVVSPIPGTTRDWVSVTLNLHGYSFTLVDTAGRRAGADHLEQAGIHAGTQAARHADILLAVFDDSHPLSPEDLAALEPVSPQATIFILNKLDAPGAPRAAQAALPRDAAHLRVSARTGENFTALVDLIRRHASGDDSSFFEQPCLFTLRQNAIVKRVLWDLGAGRTVPAEHIRRDLAGNRADLPG